jgi:hypothetical protein
MTIWVDSLSRLFVLSIDIDLRKILSFEHERFFASHGERIGKAIAVIQPGSMPPLTVVPLGAACRVDLFGINRDDLGPDFEQPKIELPTACITQQRFKHDRGFERGRRGD